MAANRSLRLVGIGAFGRVAGLMSVVAASLVVSSGSAVAVDSATTTTTLPASTASLSPLLQGCTQIVDFHDQLTTAKGKQTKTPFSAKSDAKTLTAIAKELAAAPGVGKLAVNLRKAQAGTQRRTAINKVYHWCDGQGAFEPTKITLQARFDVVDSDTVQITGTSEPGAAIYVTKSGVSASAPLAHTTADANGAFTVVVPDIPLNQDVTVFVSATAPGRDASGATTVVKRTQSPAAIAAAAAAAEAQAKAAEADFKAQAVQMPYNELIKYAPGTLGKAVTYRVQVFQYDFNTGPTKFLGYVTPGNYFWSDLILFTLPNAALGSGVVKGGYVRVWGTVGAPYTYSTAIGSNSVPTVTIKYIEPA